MGTKGDSPLQAGINFLPIATATVPFAILAGQIVDRTGKYKPIHFFGHAIVALGLGLWGWCDETSGPALWATFQIMIAAGGGLVLPTMLTAVLAALPESDVATATGAYSFLRQFGMIWGFTLGAVVFNQKFELTVVSDPGLVEKFSDGAAYGQSSTQLYSSNLSPADKRAIVKAYVPAVAGVFYTCAGLEVVSFLLVFLERQIELRAKLNTEYGLARNDERSPGRSDEEDQAAKS